ncbi:MAG TPA: hypothetical protein VJJ47_01440 [Candidatus Paceibacterota bacterium]
MKFLVRAKVGAGCGSKHRANIIDAEDTECAIIKFKKLYRDHSLFDNLSAVLVEDLPDGMAVLGEW